jgi:exonuclease SbcC
MILKSIKLKNIRSFLDETISFPTGSLLLSGDIGSGKSTILLAIDFVLFGLRRGELSGSDLLRHGKNSGSVELVFSAGRQDISIKRTLKRGRNSITQDSGIIEVNNTRREMMPTELRAKILEIFGYPETRNNLFRYTVYCPQEQMKHILFYPEERLNTLRKIFDIEKYGKIRENSKLMITELRAVRRGLEEYTKDLDEKVRKQREAESSKRDINSQLALQISLIKGINERQEKMRAGIERNEAAIKELDKVESEVIRKETELEAMSNRTEKIGIEIQDIEKKLALYSNELRQYSEVKPQRSMDEIRSMMTKSEKEKESLITEKAIISDDIRKLQNILEKGICDTCEQEVHSPAAFKENIGRKLNKEKEIAQGIDKVSSLVEKLRKEQEELSKYTIMAEKKLQLESIMRDMEKNKVALETEGVSLEKKTAAITKELSLLKPKLSSLATLEAESKKLRENFDNILRQKLDAEKTQSRMEQQLESIETELASIEDEIKEKLKSREKIRRIDDTIGFFDSYFINLMLLIEKNVMAAIQEEFNSLFQEWFRILIGDELSVRVDEQFSPVIEQNGYETEYNNLSGGEKTSVALAYRLALNKVINSLIETIKTKDLLILDEPTDGFSSEQLDRMGDIINELKLRQVIIVSHEPKIDTFVDNVIKLYKEGHVSRISQ